VSISGKADLYALGCCLFEMLTGQKVFDGENFAQLFEQHLRMPPRRVATLVADCPSELDQIVDQCLAKTPEKRPFNARAVQGVMLELGHSFNNAADVTETTEGTGTAEQDVSADEVHSRARQLLIEQIRTQGLTTVPDISWTRLLILITIIVAIVTVFSILNS
jgi:serine/threonine protein kinase